MNNQGTIMSIEITQLSKRYGDFTALHPSDLSIAKGEMVTLLGASGSGKTTLLRLIAGLESADGGSIRVQGKEVRNVPARERHIGFVFQHYALFKHMTVADNVDFGLRVLPRKQRPNKAKRRKIVNHLLEMVQLAHLQQRYPASLSGGQQQRIALARALATQPQVVLFDEPFGALDVKVRQDLRLWLKELQKELGFTGVFVTHDQEEALDLADRVVIMQDGNILQTATAEALFATPENSTVFRFINEVHEWAVDIQQQFVKLSSYAWLKSDQALNQQSGTLALRNQDIRLDERPAPRAQLPVSISAIALLGSQYRLTLQCEGWGANQPWQIMQPVQSFFKQPPALGKRYYINPKQVYLLSDKHHAPMPLLSGEYDA